MFSLGIDVGYSAVKIALVDRQGGIRHCDYSMHTGQVAKAMKTLIARLYERNDPAAISYGAVTGSGVALLAGPGLIQDVNEVAALVEGALLLAPSARSVIEMGGQTAKYVTGFSPEDKSRMEVSINSNCASGTGSFLEEQVSRLGLAGEDYSVYAARARSVPRIAGRCSVFAKTDIIHHQQEGVPMEDILQGLAHALARNFRSAVMRRLPRKFPILFTGGVARNSAIVSALREILKISSDDLLLHEYSAMAGAVGAASLARNNRLALNVAVLTDLSEEDVSYDRNQSVALSLPSLAGLGTDDAAGKHDTVGLVTGQGPIPCWLGIDVGSTSTNLVLSDDQDRIVDHLYLRTAGDPIEAVRQGLRRLAEARGEAVSVQGVAVTGSGRYMIGRLVGADLVRDEITAQARAAVAINPRVDTVFEIGGQDSKFIALENGVVTDFQMNKVCAAGTGSFLEEQAKKLNLPLEEFGVLALDALRPVNLGERCTVFMEASVAAHLAQGEALDNLAAGLCYSIVKNYLNRVVSGKRVGKVVMLQGGLGYNQGVINAFRVLTGSEITVPPFFSVTGAYGAAILARESMADQEEGTAFKGFFPPVDQELGAHQRNASQIQGLSGFNQRINDLVFQGHDETPVPGKMTVGIPRALFTFGMFPMFGAFFKALGCNVLLSGPTGEETIREAQESSLDETCWPVKLINGHVAELVARKVDFIFFPDLHTVYHPGSLSRLDYGCAYMQLAFKIINQAMDLASKGITLLAPTIAFNQGPEFMRETFMEMGRKMGKSDQDIGLALQTAMQSYRAFEAGLEERSKRTLANLVPGRKTFVLISKIYGVGDQALNMGIPDKLADMGYDVLAFPDLPEIDIFKQHPNMYWPFGQHILEAARQVKLHPDLYAVFLTHHGCGPDTVLSHYFREIMGDKPYLAIEVDEHSSGVGVITRVEAFVNSLEKNIALQPRDHVPEVSLEADKVNILAGIGKLDSGTRVYLPRLFPYADLAQALLVSKKLDARLVLPTTAASIDAGRQHAVTNEYYSMTALLGDVLTSLVQEKTTGPRAVFIPQDQGAEVDGQYARFLRCKLDAEGYQDVEVVSPFLEDLANLSDRDVEDLFYCLLAGDVVSSARGTKKGELLVKAIQHVRNGRLKQGSLVALAQEARSDNTEFQQSGTKGKAVFAVGEPMVLYNDLLNDHTFQRLEEAGHRVVRAPLGECLWTLWMDHLEHDRPENGERLRRLLDHLAGLMGMVSQALGQFTPYAKDPDSLRRIADEAIGLYAGAFGRYRAARALTPPAGTDGLISVASMYENTGISLGILHKGLAEGRTIPWLDLTFDGTRNENDRTKTESFIYYL